MVYFKRFLTEAEKSACTAQNEYVSYTDESNIVNIHPYDYSKDYLTFVALESGTFKFSGSSSGSTANKIQYSTDDGETWSTASSSVTVNVTSGDKVLWKSSNLIPYSNKGIGNFSASTAQYDIEGNIMSLIYGDSFNGQTSFGGFSSVFQSLFEATNCVNASNLILPATTLAQRCYYNMFQRCTALTTAPELPATTLADYCYSTMFASCTSLTNAPVLPATTLAQRCYYSMFQGCTSLTTAPALPATTLSDSCYYNMFQRCTALTTAPELPATTLAPNCYQYMFQGCTALTTAPQLPATKLANYCYREMFSGCTNLNNITMLATNTSASNCLTNWVSGVAANGTFTKAASMTTLPSGGSGIPTGWTVVDAT